MSHLQGFARRAADPEAYLWPPETGHAIFMGPPLLLALVLLASCDITEPDPVPASVAIVPGAMELDALDATLTMSAVVRDETGQALRGVPLEWSSDDPSRITVSAEGVVTARSNGSATISARAGEATGTATLQVRQVARQVDPLRGDDQQARAGEPLAEQIAIQVLDRLDNPVAGAEVRFDPSPGGTASPSRTEADAQGIASTRWTLGPEPGTQSLAITVGERHTFHLLASALDEEGEVPFRIRLRFLSEPTPALRQAFQEATARWEPLFREKLMPVLVRVPEGRCGENAPPMDEVVDDLLILVTEEFIDGPEGVVALATPCFLRQDGMLPIVGQIRLDRDDLEALDELGILSDIVAHEIAHVLGLGALWELFEFLQQPSLPDNRGADTHFTGPLAIQAFDAVGGEGFAGAKVPVENELGDAGTRDRHWRQAVFGSELMTGFLSTIRPNPLSRVTLASLADLGYRVRLDRAEPFTLNLASAVAPHGEGIFPIVHPPARSETYYVVGPTGALLDDYPW